MVLQYTWDIFSLHVVVKVRILHGTNDCIDILMDEPLAQRVA